MCSQLSGGPVEAVRADPGSAPWPPRRRSQGRHRHGAPGATATSAAGEHAGADAESWPPEPSSPSGVPGRVRGGPDANRTSPRTRQEARKDEGQAAAVMAEGDARTPPRSPRRMGTP
ncbi:hypothetical protein QJS66_18795 [Kocuria rhizophila]|nr:hypothetical protein QJS66_18795 [Kocuria rhizophila]